MRKNQKLLKAIFYINIVFVVFLNLILEKELKVHSYYSFPFLFILYFFFYYSNLMDFSDKIRIDYPEFFKKHKQAFGYFKDELINPFNLINNNDFKSIEDTEIQNLLQSCFCFKLSVLSFIAFPVFVILFNYIY